jgi:hypothetical protein
MPARSARHTYRRGAGTVIAAILALSFFAVSPLLLAHHHHENGEREDQCAICLFVSGQVTAAPVPFDAAPQMTTLCLVEPIDETPRAIRSIHFDNERAPPSA